MKQVPARRALLAGAAALLTRAPVTNPAHAAGPPVWLDLDQQSLDDAYDQSKYAPNARQVQARFTSNSDAARAALGPPRRRAYGSTPVEALDHFPTTAPGAPIAIFIHGGAWLGGAASDYAFLAEIFVAHGIHAIIPDFTNIKSAAGDLTPMAQQVQRAIAWVHQNAATLGADPTRIHLFAHSSGAHLAACALTAAPATPIKSALLCSGLYDLKPVRLSSRSRYVAFTDDMEQSLSPQRHLDRLTTPMILATGTLETPEFKRQTRSLADALQARSTPAETVIGQNYNHFEMIETLASPYGLLGRAALAQITG